MPRVTSSQLRDILHYDKDTGVFTWIKPPDSQPDRIGKRAGTMTMPTHNGIQYRKIGIGKVVYQASHLAWLYCKRTWPDGNLIHLNGDTTDDRISNLKERSK